MEPAPSDVPEDLVIRARDLGAAVVILPVRHVDGLAVYPEASVTIVKELRSMGVDAQYLDAPADRTFEVKKSGLETAIATLVFGVASNAAWDAMKALIGQRRARRMSVTYIDLETADAKGRAWNVDGDADDVLDAIDRLRGNDGA